MNLLIIVLIAAVVVIFILGAVFSALKAASTKPEGGINYAFEKQNALLSPAEQCFFKALETVIDGTRLIFAKVRLEDLIAVKRGTEKKEAFGLRNRIKSRHVDFVLCDKQTYEVVLCIELDDKSHQQKNRMERDAFVDQALASAGIPVKRVQAKASYDIEVLRKELVGRSLNKTEDTIQEEASRDLDSTE